MCAHFPEAHMAEKPAKKQSGGARLMASGRRPFMMGLPTDIYDRLAAVAQAEHMPMTVFGLRALVAAIEATEKKLRKSTSAP